MNHLIQIGASECESFDSDRSVNHLIQIGPSECESFDSDRSFGV